MPSDGAESRAYQSGWMGLRSFPMTYASGQRSAPQPCSMGERQRLISALGKLFATSIAPVFSSAQPMTLERQDSSTHKYRSQSPCPESWISCSHHRRQKHLVAYPLGHDLVKEVEANRFFLVVGQHVACGGQRSLLGLNQGNVLPARTA